jgi:hypothetical protein
MGSNPCPPTLVDYIVDTTKVQPLIVTDQAAMTSATGQAGTRDISGFTRRLVGVTCYNKGTLEKLRHGKGWLTNGRPFFPAPTDRWDGNIVMRRGRPFLVSCDAKMVVHVRDH